jgi:hypothetical protein
LTLEKVSYPSTNPDHPPTVKLRLVECPFCGTDLRGRSPDPHLRDPNRCPDAPREVPDDVDV